MDRKEYFMVIKNLMYVILIHKSPPLGEKNLPFDAFFFIEKAIYPKHTGISEA